MCLTRHDVTAAAAAQSVCRLCCAVYVLTRYVLTRVGIRRNGTLGRYSATDAEPFAEIVLLRHGGRRLHQTEIQIAQSLVVYSANQRSNSFVYGTNAPGHSRAELAPKSDRGAPERELPRNLSQATCVRSAVALGGGYDQHRRLRQYNSHVYGLYCSKGREAGRDKGIFSRRGRAAAGWPGRFAPGHDKWG